MVGGGRVVGGGGGGGGGKWIEAQERNGVREM
jgi:hypothetical protein